MTYFKLPPSGPPTGWPTADPLPLVVHDPPAALPPTLTDDGAVLHLTVQNAFHHAPLAAAAAAAAGAGVGGDGWELVEVWAGEIGPLNLAVSHGVGSGTGADASGSAAAAVLTGLAVGLPTAAHVLVTLQAQGDALGHQAPASSQLQHPHAEHGTYDPQLDAGGHHPLQHAHLHHQLQHLHQQPHAQQPYQQPYQHQQQDPASLAVPRVYVPQDGPPAAHASARPAQPIVFVRRALGDGVVRPLPALLVSLRLAARATEADRDVVAALLPAGRQFSGWALAVGLDGTLELVRS